MRVLLVALALLGSGPALSATPGDLDTAMECSGPLTGLTRDPVLLTPAFSTAAESYGWNYRRQLPAIGITTCTLSLPDNGFGDLQADAQYVVAAVRRMRAESGRQVVMMGHQHGALDELWAMTFWPDVARDTSELISLATPYNGTTIAQGTVRVERLPGLGVADQPGLGVPGGAEGGRAAEGPRLHVRSPPRGTSSSSPSRRRATSTAASASPCRTSARAGSPTTSRSWPTRPRTPWCSMRSTIPVRPIRRAWTARCVRRR